MKRIVGLLLWVLPMLLQAQAKTVEGLTSNSHNIHFNTASARELGKRYATQMLLLQKEK